MNVIGILSWYDESASWLATAVAGFARVCDTIVAVDGAYGLYPGARARSMPEQSEAILGAAEAAGAGCVVHRPKHVWWGNEVEKRNHTLRVAGTIAADGDWVLVFDGDYQLMQTDPMEVRRTLGETQAVVASYTLLDGIDVAATMEANIARTLPIDTDWTFRTRDIFRWTDDLEYVANHYTVRGTYDGIVRYPKGPESQLGNTAVEDCCHLGRSLVAYHRRSHRPFLRQQAADGYRELRNKRGAETPLPEVLAG